MSRSALAELGYRFPPEVIQQAIWLYVRFTLSFRDVEDLLAERGIMVSYETVRRWVNHFGPMIAADLRKRRPKPHTTWHLDEVYLKIDGRMVYLWRAVDAEGEVLDVLVRARFAFCSLNGLHRIPCHTFLIGRFGISRNLVQRSVAENCSNLTG
jgi:transposase-like protein